LTASHAGSNLFEFGSYPEIYADGIGDIQVLGGNARLVYFTWQRIDGVFRRSIVATMIRHVSSLAADFDLIASAKKRPQLAPNESVATLQ